MVLGLPVIINVFKNEYHTRNGMKKETAARLLRSWVDGDKLEGVDDGILS